MAMTGATMQARWRARAAAMSAAALLVAGAAACAAPPANPDGSVSQAAPLSVHGMAREGSKVWAADLLGGQLVRFDPASGAIDERYNVQNVCRPDDVVVLPGNDLAATCPTQGLVIRVHRGGAAVVLASVGVGVNPIVLDPSGTSVLVGFTYGGDNRLLRVPLDGSPVTTVASGLPNLSGFGFGPDGYLWVPTGGADGSLGTGGIGRIDISTGAFTPLTLSFPAEPARTGLDFASGIDVAADGTLFAAQALNAAAYAVSPITGAATSLGPSPVNPADNVLTLGDGRVVLSSFSGGSVTVYTPSGPGYATPVLAIGH